ncbi:MAG: CD225/dispanin family protein [Candidatus Nanopelagicales bacterium]
MDVDVTGEGGQAAGQSRQIRVPSSWLAPAVVVTLCCFSPTGIVAVYYAAQVSVNWRTGERREASRCARLARRWVWVSVLLWALVTLVLIATGRFGRLLEAGVV